MKTGYVLFNGVRFPFELMDEAIAWASENKASLTAVFLHSSAQDDEGYGFPSDIDAATDFKDESDATRSNEKLLKSYVRLLRDTAAARQVSITVISKEESSKEELLKRLEAADKVFVDSTPDKDSVPWGITSFELSELEKR